MVDLIELKEKPSNEEELTQVNFDPIPIGHSDKTTIYVKNVTEQTVQIDPRVDEVSGSGTVSILSYDDSIQSGESAEIELEAKAISSDQISGISTSITVDAKAIVPPNQKL